MKNVVELSISELAGLEFQCTCGKNHKVEIDKIAIGNNILDEIDDIIETIKGKKLLLIADINTYAAAGQSVEECLKKVAEVKSYVFNNKHQIPDEEALGSLIVSVDKDVDMLIAVGSGTINDITRYISYKMNIPYSIIGTAPSMDGYASVVSPLIVNGMKTTYNAVYPQNIIGDIEVLKKAPMQMLNAGLGDVLGKYTALCDWRIAKLLNNEYYCEDTAALVEKALDKCSKSCRNLGARDNESINDLIEALILTGVCIGMVDSSRPASGEEHHMSHFWEIKSIEDGNYGTWLHGNMVGVGTVVIAEALKYLKTLDKDKLLQSRNYLKLTKEVWHENIRRSYGLKAESIIKFKENSIDFDQSKREKRFSDIYNNWDEIMKIAEEVLSHSEDINSLLKGNGAPASPLDLGLSRDMFYNSVIGAKDIRKRYGTLQVLEDLGVLEEAAQYLTNLFYA